MKQMKIDPAEQRVIILPDESVESRTASGIIIPATAEEHKPIVGEIVAVGLGSADNPMWYSVGQRIIMSSYSGVEVKLNLVGYGEHIYKVVNQMDIMAVVQEID